MADRLPMTAELLDYLGSHGTREEAVLSELRRKTEELAHSDMRVPVEEGQFLQFMIKAINARKVMELGVFTGYSTLWMALALPRDGKVYAFDKRDAWQEVCEEFWRRARVRDKIDFRVGRAQDFMETLLEQGHAGTFDLIFIDADKKNYTVYYELALRLLRTGGIMIFDNMLRSGDVVRPGFDEDPAVIDIRALNSLLKADKRVAISMLPFADGVTLVLKEPDVNL
ncbi:O-methyltransferase [Roseibium sp. RKSG952]|uniref:O-methyltransferase n=1 Tax=Roseibium sp. RKSG952 TaxID=2529384 RepID=UPI0012BBF98D|nr:class I SAM-dependent methyltransferase [Roseibium sp. RKSG952]MTH98954.1 methyltransferase [Roseibium sp. RKSG952]